MRKATYLAGRRVGAVALISVLLATTAPAAATAAVLAPAASAHQLTAPDAEPVGCGYGGEDYCEDDSDDDSPEEGGHEGGGSGCAPTCGGHGHSHRTPTSTEIHEKRTDPSGCDGSRCSPPRNRPEFADSAVGHASTTRSRCSTALSGVLGYG